MTCLWASSFWWNRLIPYVAGWPFWAGTFAATELIRSCLAALSGISPTWVMTYDGRIFCAQMTWWKFSLWPLTQHVFEAGGQSDLVPFPLSDGKRQGRGRGGGGWIMENSVTGQIVSIFCHSVRLGFPLSDSLELLLGCYSRWGQLCLEITCLGKICLSSNLFFYALDISIVRIFCMF